MSSAGIDWAGIRSRIQQAEQQLAAGARATPEQERAILQERARAVADPVQLTAGVENILREVLVFRVNQSSYGVDIDQVAEVLPTGNVTQIPGAPPFVAGVTSRRGELIALVDLDRLFGRLRSGVADLTHAVVVAHGGIKTGLLAEHIEGIALLSTDSFTPPLDKQEGVEAIAESHIVVLDVHALMEILTPNRKGAFHGK